MGGGFIYGLERYLFQLNQAIDLELCNLKYYRALSTITQNEFWANTLIDFSHDEFNHFLVLIDINQDLKGPNYSLEGRYDIKLVDFVSSMEALIYNTTRNFMDLKDIYQVTRENFKTPLLNILMEEVFHLRELYLFFRDYLEG